MQPILAFISILLELINVAIIIRILMSWVQTSKSSPIYLFVRDVTEPVLGPFKKVIPRIGMLDISPIFAILAIDFARSLVISLMTAQ